MARNYLYTTFQTTSTTSQLPSTVPPSHDDRSPMRSVESLTTAFRFGNATSQLKHSDYIKYLPLLDTSDIVHIRDDNHNLTLPAMLLFLLPQKKNIQLRSVEARPILPIFKPKIRHSRSSGHWLEAHRLCSVNRWIRCHLPGYGYKSDWRPPRNHQRSIIGRRAEQCDDGICCSLSGLRAINVKTTSFVADNEPASQIWTK